MLIAAKQQTSNNKIRPFIKWPGSKYSVLDILLPKLPPASILVEPFVGSGAVFLNTNYQLYKLSDTNLELINLYNMLKIHGKAFINFCETFFIKQHNTADYYYKLRDQFNTHPKDLVTRAALFLYLNRHGYNGLCRFNLSNKFNVPFGRYKDPVFPKQGMLNFLAKTPTAKFVVQDFQQCLRKILSTKNPKHMVVYCDPPYVPLSTTANFTSYSAGGFGETEQKILADLAMRLAIKGIPVLLSNHFTALTKQIYSKATELTTFKIRRMISCKVTDRKQVTEVLALYAN